MQLDQSTIKEYIGGEIDVQNQKERYMYRGQIESATINEAGDELTLTLSWMAKGIGFPPVPSKWIRDSVLTYTISLDLYSFMRVGRNYLWLNSYATGEVVHIYPPGTNKFDQSLIREQRDTHALA